MRKALFFIDEGAIKIVFGATVKVLKPEDAALAHNQAFLNKLFSDFSVYFAATLAEASKAEFDEFLARAQQRGLPEQQPQASQPQAATAAPKPPTRPRPPLPRPSPLEAPRPHQAADLTWIKLRDGAPTVVVDDLLTNEMVRDIPGTRASLVIQSGLAVNLAELNPDEVRKSTILRKLIQNKAVVFTTADDALRMKIEHDEEVANQPMPNRGSDIIDRDSGRPVDSTKIGGQQEEEPGALQDHDAPTMDITDEAKEETTDADFVSAEDSALRGIFGSMPASRPDAPAEEEDQARVVALPPPKPRVNLGDPNRPKGSLRRK